MIQKMREIEWCLVRVKADGTYHWAWEVKDKVEQKPYEAIEDDML